MLWSVPEPLPAIAMQLFTIIHELSLFSVLLQSDREVTEVLHSLDPTSVSLVRPEKSCPKVCFPGL